VKTADPRRELEILLASHFALIAVNSREESRVLHLLRDAGKKASRGRNWALFQWSVTEGLRRLDTDMGGAQRTNAEPQRCSTRLSHEKWAIVSVRRSPTTMSARPASTGSTRRSMSSPLY
jgi:hypothetical protein